MKTEILLQKNLRPISALQEGTVVDHIQAGQALKIFKMLQLKRYRTTIALNLESRSMGKKDLLKIDSLFLKESEASPIAIFSPTATISIIKNFELIKKFKVKMPEIITASLDCPNERCITHFAKLSPYFLLEEIQDKILLCCKYCEKAFPPDRFE